MSEGNRIGMIDIARFYAMVFVFYGHFIERIMLLENPAAALQYKLIYSFHMVLFVVLAGYVARENDTERSFGAYAKVRLVSRLLPFLFFTLLFMGLAAFLPGDFFFLKLPSVEGYLTGLTLTAFGLPLFCVPSWFILLIFSVEMLHYGASRVLRFSKASTSTLLLAALGFYVVGYWGNLYLDVFDPAKGRIVGWNYLFIHEAITMYAFYLLGIALRRKPKLIEQLPVGKAWIGAFLALLVVAFTFELNTGPFNVNYHESVVIMFSSHGHFVWFPITAVAGSLFVLFVARGTAPIRGLMWLGRNTLLLLFLNGFFYHYINPVLAKWLVDTIPGQFFNVLSLGGVVTVISLVLCIPFVYLFDTYLPQLCGKPRQRGPLMPSLIG